MNDMTRPDPANTFPALLKSYSTEIARALPKHMDGERMARIALTEFRKNPRLAECEPKSVFAAVIVASQLGLEPGVLGQAYLVPYKMSKKVGNRWEEHFECQLIPGWQGYADLVARAGRASVWTGAVFKGDEFEYAQGDRPFITHKRGDEEETEANLTYVYAVGRIKNAEWPVIEVWSVEKVRRHLAKYNKQGEKHYALKGNLEMYGRKVALLQVIKYMPKSPELGTAVELDHAGSRGGQNLKDAKDVLQGTWAVEPETDGEDPPPPPDAAAPVVAAKPALPPYDAEAFKKNLKGWLKRIEDRQKTADEIVAMLSSKNTLSMEQIGLIHGWDTTLVSPQQLNDLQAAAARAALTDVEVAKHLKVEALDKITVAQFHAALAFCANPAGSAA